MASTAPTQPERHDSWIDLTGLSAAGSSVLARCMEEGMYGPNTTRTELARMLEGEDYRWPAFEAWRTYFSSIGYLPSNWSRVLLEHPLSDASGSRSALGWEHTNDIALVLALTISAETSARRRFSEMTEAGITTVKLATARDRHVAPICRALARKRIGLHPSNLPPLYPGCRCVAVAVIDI